MEKKDFILHEYEKCVELIQYFDERMISLLKFSVILCSSIAIAIYTVFKLTTQMADQSVLALNSFYLLAFFLCLVSWLGNLLIAFAILKNREYYTACSRQVNAIREYALAITNPDFLRDFNRMSINRNIRVYKTDSIHFYILLVTFILSVISVFSMVFFIMQYLGLGMHWSVITGIAIMFFCFFYFQQYLARLMRQAQPKKL